MSERLSDLGGKLLAGVVLLVAGWLLLKFIIGVVTWIATVAVVIVAVFAVIWALNRLL
jgi:hypothetical protein